MTKVISGAVNTWTSQRHCRAMSSIHGGDSTDRKWKSPSSSVLVSSSRPVLHCWLRPTTSSEVGGGGKTELQGVGVRTIWNNKHRTQSQPFEVSVISPNGDTTVWWTGQWVNGHGVRNHRNHTDWESWSGGGSEPSAPPRPPSCCQTPAAQRLS